MIGSSRGKLLVFAVFLLGIGTGALGTYEYNARVIEPRDASTGNRDRGQRERRAQEDVNRFHDYLGLNDEQRDQVNKILEENRMEFRELQAKTRPEFQMIQDSTRDKIRAILDDGQKQKYDEFFNKQRRTGGRRGN